MRILICDNDHQYASKVKMYIEHFMQLHFINYKIDIAYNPLEVANNDIIYQLAFLDIQMDELDGISLAKILKERNNKIVIFFITSYTKFQDDAMDVNAFRFFEKPIDINRLYSGLERAIKFIDDNYIDFYIYTNNEHKNIKVDDVIYIERGNRHVMLVTTEGKYITRETFDEWCDIIQNSFFYKVHKSFIINLHHVINYKYSEVRMQNNVCIPIASRRQADFHKFWNIYLKKR